MAWLEALSDSFLCSDFFTVVELMLYYRFRWIFLHTEQSKLGEGFANKIELSSFIVKPGRF